VSKKDFTSFYLGIKDFASSAFSGHRFASAACSNLCNCFLDKRLKEQSTQSNEGKKA
jgi:hypothetical protein